MERRKDHEDWAAKALAEMVGAFLALIAVILIVSILCDLMKVRRRLPPMTKAQREHRDAVRAAFNKESPRVVTSKLTEQQAAVLSAEKAGARVCDTARELGVTAERVRHIEISAKNRLLSKPIAGPSRASSERPARKSKAKKSKAKTKGKRKARAKKTVAAAAA